MLFRLARRCLRLRCQLASHRLNNALSGRPFHSSLLKAHAAGAKRPSASSRRSGSASPLAANPLPRSPKAPLPCIRGVRTPGNNTLSISGTSRRVILSEALARPSRSTLKMSGGIHPSAFITRSTGLPISAAPSEHRLLTVTAATWTPASAPCASAPLSVPGTPSKCPAHTLPPHLTDDNCGRSIVMPSASPSLLAPVCASMSLAAARPAATVATIGTG